MVLNDCWKALLMFADAKLHSIPLQRPWLRQLRSAMFCRYLRAIEFGTHDTRCWRAHRKFRRPALWSIRLSKHSQQFSQALHQLAAPRVDVDPKLGNQGIGKAELCQGVGSNGELADAHHPHTKL